MEIISLQTLIAIIILGVLFVTTCESVTCTGAQHKIQHGNTFVCENCDDRKCRPGHELSPPCGETVYENTKVFCKPCDKGTYSDNYSIEHCKPCRHCRKENREVLEKCISERNAICGNCSQGFYKDVEENKCFCCSYCCEDEKDDVANECMNVMPKDRQCRVNNQQGKCDKELKWGCPVAESKHKNIDNGSSVGLSVGAIIGIVLLSLVVVVAGVSCLFYHFVWKKRRLAPQRLVDHNLHPIVVCQNEGDAYSPRHVVPNLETNNNTSANMKISEGLTVHLPPGGASTSEEKQKTNDMQGDSIPVSSVEPSADNNRTAEIKTVGSTTHSSEEPTVDGSKEKQYSNGGQIKRSDSFQSSNPSAGNSKRRLSLIRKISLSSNQSEDTTSILSDEEHDTAQLEEGNGQVYGQVSGESSCLTLLSQRQYQHFYQVHQMLNSTPKNLNAGSSRRPSFTRQSSEERRLSKEKKKTLTLSEVHEHDGVECEDVDDQVNEFIKVNTLETLFGSAIICDEIGTKLESCTPGVNNWAHVADKFKLEDLVKEKLKHVSDSGGDVGKILLEHLKTSHPDEKIEVFLKYLKDLRLNNVCNAVKRLIREQFLPKVEK